MITFALSQLRAPIASAMLVGALEIANSIIMPPPGTEWPFVLNVLFWSGVIATWIGIAVGLTALFRRRPSLNEILARLVNVPDFDQYKEEQRLRCVGLEKQISDARHQFDERANSDLKRNIELFDQVFVRSEQRDKTIARISDSVSRMQERTEGHMRKIDQYDTKLDNLLREVSKAAAAGVKSAQS